MVQKILISGGGSKLRGPARVPRRRFEDSVERFDPFAASGGRAPLRPPTTCATGAGMAVAVGSALRWRGSVNVKFNLLDSVTDRARSVRVAAERRRQPARGRGCWPRTVFCVDGRRMIFDYALSPASYKYAAGRRS